MFNINNYSNLLAGYVDLDNNEYNLGLIGSTIPNTLTFIDQEKYIPTLNKNTNIKCVIIHPELVNKVESGSLTLIQSLQPRWDYYQIHNAIAKDNYLTFASNIHPTAEVHPRAYVAEHNVIIGARTKIFPNATILEDSEIGEDCIVYSGAVVGSEGFEYKMFDDKILPVIHNGKAILEDKVHISANANVDKGFAQRHTIIGEETKIDKFSHVSHNVHIGKRTLVTAGTIIGGSTTIGDNVYIGLNATLLPGITIGNKAFISMGSVVTRNVEDGQQVTGNFAIPHKQFLAHLKSM